jgi:Tfp pilus assembly protein FimT
MDLTGKMGEKMISEIGNKGIVLIELCIVGVILSILLMLIYPVLNQFNSNIQLESICKNISYTMRYTKDLALNESRNYMIEFLEDKYVIKAEKDPLNNPNEFEIINDNLNLKRTWSKQFKIKSISNKQILFRPDGSSENFNISLENQKGDVCALELNGLTGKYKITKA